MRHICLELFQINIALFKEVSTETNTSELKAFKRQFPSLTFFTLYGLKTVWEPPQNQLIASQPCLFSF